MNVFKSFGRSCKASGLLRSLRSSAIATLIAGTALTAVPAVALTPEDAAKVADIIAALQPALGRFAYDEDIARYWFQEDAAGDRVIQSAGFTAESWQVAVGETFRGLVALMPQDEIDDLRAKLDAGMDGATQLSTEQQAEFMQELEAEFQAFLQLRDEGAGFADAVRPVERRLTRILESAVE